MSRNDLKVTLQTSCILELLRVADKAVFRIDSLLRFINMNGQEINSPSPAQEQSIAGKRRRFIKGAGAAPIILTLSSPSVFGVPTLCGSQIASGNQSHIVTPNCETGLNVAFFADPVNRAAWLKAGFDFGTLKDPKLTKPKCDDFKGGTTFNNAFGTNVSKDLTMREIICAEQANPNNSLNAYLVAALLNASTPGSKYLFSVDQVKKLQNGSLGVPPNNSTNKSDVLKFLKLTMP